jgi:hypothetical protein
MKVDWFEIGVISLCLLFVTAISLYHISYNGYLGISENGWSTIWAVAENGFSLFLCVLVANAIQGTIRKLFNWIFVPYFALKLIYHVSCYSGIYLLSKEIWEFIWSFVLVFMIIGSLLYCFNLTRNRHVD